MSHDANWNELREEATCPFIWFWCHFDYAQFAYSPKHFAYGCYIRHLRLCAHIANKTQTHGSIQLVPSWGEPERAPRSHDVYCTCVRTCVRTYLRAYLRAYVSARPAWERVKSVITDWERVEACLGTSEVNVAGNDCSLRFGSLRTSVG